MMRNGFIDWYVLKNGFMLMMRFFLIGRLLMGLMVISLGRLCTSILHASWLTLLICIAFESQML